MGFSLLHLLGFLQSAYTPAVGSFNSIALRDCH
jgi:hypothetical protein